MKKTIIIVGMFLSGVGLLQAMPNPNPEADTEEVAADGGRGRLFPLPRRPLYKDGGMRPPQ